MMMEFAEQNKRLLRFYGFAANFLGHVLFGFGLLWGALFSVSIVSRLGDTKAMLTQINEMPNGIVMFILSGLIAVGTSQFIRYLIEKDYQPQGLLRHGDTILYTGAFLVVLNSYWLLLNSVPLPGPWGPYTCHIERLFLILITFAKVLTLMGLGQVLKRILPIIGESKTLV
ncbi:MAG: hypothetical protein WC975_10130 [Phycisphaerae bacterium]